MKARELAMKGLSLHPSEPIFALTGAEVAVRERDPSAGRWINRAQVLAPLWSAPHLLAARWLFSLGELDQTLIEIREAEALRPGSAQDDRVLNAPPQCKSGHRIACRARGS